MLAVCSSGEATRSDWQHVIGPADALSGPNPITYWQTVFSVPSAPRKESASMLSGYL